MNFQIVIKKSAKSELASLNKNIQLKIASIIDSLKENPLPDNCKKLRWKEYIYRIRYRNYRILYSVKKQTLIIEILKIGKRDTIYKKFIKSKLR